MNFIDKVIEKAKTNIKTIVLPESEDIRVLEAASKITKAGFVTFFREFKLVLTQISVRLLVLSINQCLTKLCIPDSHNTLLHLCLL